MDHDALTPSESIEQQEQILRYQLHEGCRLARELDERVRSIPAGKLCIGSEQTEAAASSSAAAAAAAAIQLRCDIAMATAHVVGAFNRAVQLLLQSSICTYDQSTALSAASSPLQNALHSSPQQKPTTPYVPGSAMAITVPLGNTKSPPLSPPGKHRAAPSALHRADHGKQQSNMASASTSASPPGTIHSPLLSATSEMSDGSPTQPDLPADEATTAIPTNTEMYRKRKLQPKVALKVLAGDAEAADSNTPPDDGHTWRKYGQKNILGSRYPRSYYRCTHKTDTGCPALKHVQRCDEDDSRFDVVYKGYHTCRSAELDKACWPLAFPQGLSNFLHFQNNRSTASLVPPEAASLVLANMSAATQTSAGALRPAHHAGLDNLIAHQLRHVLSAAGSHNADLSVSQSFTANAAPGAEHDLISALRPYQFSSGQPLLDHLPPLFSISSASIQDHGSSSKEQLAKGTATSEGFDHGHAKGPLSLQQQETHNPLGFFWRATENSNEGVSAGYNVATAHCSSAHDIEGRHGSLLFHAKPPASDRTTMAQLTLASSGQEPPSPNCSSLQQPDDVAANSALGFSSMDNAYDVFSYLDP